MKNIHVNISTYVVIAVCILGCSLKSEKATKLFYLGGDLSYVNEMIDCGAEYRLDGTVTDPYEIFGVNGANISRLRLWHDPSDWTGYSDYEDVELAIRRSKESGMKILLDFHYSDTWADPQHQVIPKAWAEIKDTQILSDSLYSYTFRILSLLHAKGLLPEFVQIGNEVNIEIMQDSANMVIDTIYWDRNIALLNAGLKAVEDFEKVNNVEIGSMIHIAQPENGLWWFAEAERHGIADFEYIGLSYYPKWSTYGLDSLAVALDSLIKTYQKDLMIVETAYPYTLENFDEGGNILGEDSLVPGFPPSPEGQAAFFARLIEITQESGGCGVIWWEPAWVSTGCSTPWNKGSNWENSTFFDAANNNEALPIMKLLK